MQSDYMSLQNWTRETSGAFPPPTSDPEGLEPTISSHLPFYKPNKYKQKKNTKKTQTNHNKSLIAIADIIWKSQSTRLSYKKSSLFSYPLISLDTEVFEVGWSPNCSATPGSKRNRDIRRGRLGVQSWKPCCYWRIRLQHSRRSRRHSCCVLCTV